MNSLGWNAADIGGCRVYIKKLGVVSVAKILRTTQTVDWIELKKILKANKVINLRFEPRKIDAETENQARIFGLRRDNEPLRATKTILVNLKQSDEDLLKSFLRARSWINKCVSKSHKIVFNDYESFFNLWKEASKLQKIWSSNKSDFDGLIKCFKDKSFCVNIDDICGCLVLVHEKAAYYYYAAALPDAKVYSLPYLVVWEAMKKARSFGCVTWDWEGIFDPRWPNKSWAGFSQFKKTFGGQVIDLPGSWSMWNLLNFFG
jgi:lipid II:glycine glycyltransferase (peptidoglycan interpeptide bridge formation enzyme)